MPRFYLEGGLRAGARLALPESIARHVRVLRLRAGEEITLFDGRGGEIPARILAIGRNRVEVEAGEPSMIERESPLEVTLAQGVSSGERMDLTIQKSVELGVAAIQPLLAGRSAVRLGAERAGARLAHWRRVAIAACEQCGRNRVPRVEDALAVRDYCARLEPGPPRLLLSVHGGKRLAEAVPARARGLVLAAGPEGGFDAVEEALFARSGFVAVRLGPRTLRTETAAPAALAALNALLGDF
jgi:16S rRNA (uracil1498-N3)-methyltransferase